MNIDNHMNRDNLNISSIETFLYDSFNNVVSKSTFVGDKLPDKTTIPSDCKDLVLIDIPNGIRDFEAYGQGTALIYLCARPMESGKKSVSVLAEMEKSLNEAISMSVSDRYCISRRLTYTGYSNDIDWHFNAVELSVLVL